MNKNLQIAALLHCINWKYQEDIYEISPSTFLCKTSNSYVEKLYKHMCFNDGIDDGDPYIYNSHLLFNPASLKTHLGFKDSPYELLNRIINIIAIIFSAPICNIRIIHSIDNFKSYNYTSLDFSYGGQTDFLQLHGSKEFDEILLNKIKVAWNIANEYWEKEKFIGRLNSALTYFYYAWNSHYIDQVCINLAVALEILFAPSSNMELSHQISYNVAKFISNELKEREEIYNKFKKFYTIRSQIIHGFVPEDMKVIDATVDVFHILSSILSNILCSKEISDLFNNNKKRIEFFSEILFK